MSAMLKQKLIDIANGFTKYGLWKRGGSNLSELDDVTLRNLQTNDVLTYNGSEWVNDDNLQTQIDTLNSNLDLCNDFGSLYFINSFNHSTDTLVTWGYIKCRYFLLSIESEIEGTRINSIMIPTSQNGSDILYSSYKQHIISGKNMSDADCKAIFKPMSENSAIIRTVNCSLKLYAIK